MSDVGGVLRLAGFVAVVSLIVSFISHVRWPRAKCRKCKGTGKFRSPTGKAWRRCPRCKGSQDRRRLGRRIYNHYTKGTKDV